MKKYFLHNGANQLGPFDIEDLKNKNISRETPIWFEGISEWTTAEKVEELKALFQAAPPPFLITKSVLPPIEKHTATYYQPEEQKSKTGRNALIFTGLIALVGGLFIVNQNNSYSDSGNRTPTYQESVMSVEEIENAQPNIFLTASGTYNQNFFGTKLKVHGTISNKATLATYKDAIVKVTYYSKTKTELGSAEYTIYDTFPPNTTRKFELKIEKYKDVDLLGWDVINASIN